MFHSVMKKDDKEINNTKEQADAKSEAGEKQEEKKADTFSKLKDAAGKKMKKKSSKKGKKPKEPLEDQLLRLRADFDNFRKRTLRERTELYQRANEDLMEDIMPVLDHLDLALKAADDHGADESFVHGVKMVAEQLQSVLGSFGLKPIDADGADFDHNVHEAISRMQSEEFPEDKVIAQVRRGYFLGNKLLRAAQVVVSGGSADAGKSSDTVEGGN
jgi:molecular chaperone GrpE